MSITRINNNLSAINANRNLVANGRDLSKSIERLSSGLRINSAGDDAAGLTIATRIRSQVKGLDRAVMNAQDGINVISVAEGAMEEMTNRLDRMRVLAIQAANTGVNDVQARQAIQDEVFQSIDEITRIAETTQFGENRLLNGDFGVEVGTKPGQDDPQNFGIRIDNGPGATTLDSGQHFLNVRQTKEAFNLILPGTENGELARSTHTGVQNGTDIAVTLARFSQNSLTGTGVLGTDNMVQAAGSNSVFNGVSMLVSDTLAFEGVLSDGTTQFSGSLSLTAGADFGSAQDATAGAVTLLGAINHAIDLAEMAFFNVSNSNSVPSSFRTTVTLASTGTANSGRLLMVSDGQFINQSNVNMSLLRGNILVSQSRGVTRSGEIGANSAISGVGVVGNNVTAITGSTFKSGQFDIDVQDVVQAQARVVEGTLMMRDATGSIFSRDASTTNPNSSLNLNGTFVNGVFTGGTSISNGDTLAIRGTDVDGTTFLTTFTFDNAPGTDTVLNDFRFSSISGLVAEMNYRTRDFVNNTLDGRKMRFENALFTYTAGGTFALVDDLGRDNSQLDFSITIDDGPNSPNFVVQDKAELKQEGFAESASIRINGGPVTRAKAGEVVTAFGPEQTKEGEVQQQVTFRLGSNLSVGSDTMVVEAAEFVGQVNGGPQVTFQSGEQDVLFVDISAMENGVARKLTIDFDAILDITKPPETQNDPGTTLILSVNNSSMNFHIGAFANQNFRTSIGDLRADNLGFGRGSGRSVTDINVTTLSGAQESLSIIDEALNQINRTRSLLGAATNRLEGTVANLSVSSENLLAAESRLRDADIAKETSEFTKGQILLQAGTSVLAQANFLPQNFLSLLG